MKLEPTIVSLADLLLDPNNYRFLDEKPPTIVLEKRFQDESVQDAALKRLLADSHFQPLKDSILANGFLKSEPLVIKHHNDKYVVLDGNRRVATVKYIIQEYLNGSGSDKDFIDSLNVLPAIVATLDDDEHQSAYRVLMGVRHLSGIKRWGGYAEARLINDLADQSPGQLDLVAGRIGLEVTEINRRRRAYKATEQFRTHGEFGKSFKPDMYALFHEAVAIPALRDRYKWDNVEMRFSDQEAASDFFSLLVPQKEDDRVIDPKLKTFSDVRKFGKQIAPSDDLVAKLVQPDNTLDGIIANLERDREEKEWSKKVEKLLLQLNRVPALAVANATKEEVKVLQEVKIAIEKLLNSVEANLQT